MKPDVSEIMAKTTADELRGAIALLSASASSRPASARNFAGHGFIFGVGGSAPKPVSPAPTRTAAEQVDTLARAIAEQQGISETAARCQVFKGHPALRLQFVAEANQTQRSRR
jgi:hypothetical protein